MTKTCGKCGHPALDDQAQFCNRCGAVVPKERKPAFPVCPGCGAIVSDELAQFCNRCGIKIPPVPVVCSSCGSQAIDNQSRFCTRCGTTFEQKPVLRNKNCSVCGAPDPGGQSIFCNRCGAPFTRQGGQAAALAEEAPVIVTQRKTAGPLPPATIPAAEWEPWSDVQSSAPGPSGTPDLSTPEQYVYHDQQVPIPPKRYAHLPLIADELKTKGEPGPHSRAPDSPGVSHKKKTSTQKKGVLGFLKK
jgi:predicted amidophosphoribosyltransferase